MSAEPVNPAPEAGQVAAPAPGRPGPLEQLPPGSRWLCGPGFAVLVGGLEAGEGLKRWLGLVLPGNILGLFLLLGLLAAGVVPLRWVESAARLLLWLLPFLFLPIFILAMSDRAFWAVQGRALVGAVALGTAMLWAVMGLLSEYLLGRKKG